MNKVCMFQHQGNILYVGRCLMSRSVRHFSQTVKNGITGQHAMTCCHSTAAEVRLFSVGKQSWKTARPILKCVPQRGLYTSVKKFPSHTTNRLTVLCNHTRKFSMGNGLFFQGTSRPVSSIRHISSSSYMLLVSRGMATEPTATTTHIKAKVRGIQKDVSPLTTKRLKKRKRSKDLMERDQEVYDVMAYTTAEEYNLESLKKDLERHGIYRLLPLPADADVLYAEARYQVENETREMLFFREGSVIFWNMAPEERQQVIDFVQPHQLDPYDRLLMEEEFEKVEFSFTDSETKLDGDEILLKRPPPGGSLQLEKYAFSNALSVSVKLAIWEASLERYCDSIEYVLEDLKEGRKVRISRADVLRKAGELFSLRHLINLSSDLLDTPDFYWGRPELSDLYTKTCNYLNVSRRTKVMNEKLTYCGELIELVTGHLNDSHHVRLEWMIIILIMVEVAFETLHLFERYLPSMEEVHASSEQSSY